MQRQLNEVKKTKTTRKEEIKVNTRSSRKSETIRKRGRKTTR